MNTLKTTILLYVTVLTSPVFAAPQRAGEAVQTITPTYSTKSLTSTTIMHDVVDGSWPTETAKVAQVGGHLNKRLENPPEHLTIEIVNAYGQCLIRPRFATGHSVLIQEANPGNRT